MSCVIEEQVDNEMVIDRREIHGPQRKLSGIVYADSRPQIFTLKSKDILRGSKPRIARTYTSGLEHGGRYHWFKRPTPIELTRDGAFVLAKLKSVGGFSWTGRGLTKQQAIDDLGSQIDQLVLSQYRKSTMQRGDDEQGLWAAIADLFDIERFRSTVTTDTREHAQVFHESASNGSPRFRMECFGGETYVLPPSKIVGALDSLDDGQWCELIVRTRVRSGKVVQVQWGQLASAPETWTAEQVAQDLNLLPQADFPVLPDGPIRPDA